MRATLTAGPRARGRPNVLVLRIRRTGGGGGGGKAA